MRKLLLGVALAALAGCGKEDKGAPPSTGPVGQNPAVHAPGQIVINPGGGGGGGGAVQAVRGAATRAVALNDMENIKIYIEYAYGASGKMPSAQEIIAAIAREAPTTHKLLQEQAIFLSGTNNRSHIFAWTAYPTAGNIHFVLTANGVERMDGQTLKQRLEQEFRNRR